MLDWLCLGDLTFCVVTPGRHGPGRDESGHLGRCDAQRPRCVAAACCPARWWAGTEIELNRIEFCANSSSVSMVFSMMYGVGGGVRRCPARPPFANVSRLESARAGRSLVLGRCVCLAFERMAKTFKQTRTQPGLALGSCTLGTPFVHTSGSVPKHLPSQRQSCRGPTTSRAPRRKASSRLPRLPVTLLPSVGGERPTHLASSSLVSAPPSSLRPCSPSLFLSPAFPSLAPRPSLRPRCRAKAQPPPSTHVV